MSPGFRDIRRVPASLVVSLSVQPVVTAGLGDADLLLGTTPAGVGAHWLLAPAGEEDNEESEQAKDQHLTELSSSRVIGGGRTSLYPLSSHNQSTLLTGQ